VDAGPFYTLVLVRRVWYLLLAHNILLVWIRNQLYVTYVLSFISPLQVAQHVSGNQVPIFRN